MTAIKADALSRLTRAGWELECCRLADVRGSLANKATTVYIVAFAHIESGRVERDFDEKPDAAYERIAQRVDV